MRRCVVSCAQGVQTGMAIELIPSQNIDALLPLLHDADEDDARILAAIADVNNSAYLATSQGQVIGAAIMRWDEEDGDETEVLYVGVETAERGRGYGKGIMAALLDEARRRGINSVLVGTADAGLANIAFYQKCGFRIDSVRKDYFAYFKEPVYENGIRIRDMLMLRWTAGD